MKFKLFIFCSCLVSMNDLRAQAIVVGEVFSNRSVDANDSILVISTLGPVLEAYSVHDEAVVVSEPVFQFQFNTGIEGLRPIEGLKIFPNPVTDMLVFQRSSWGEEYSIEVFQTTGQSMRKVKWNKGVEAMDFSMASYAQGIYFVTISNQDLSRRSTYEIYKK